MKKETDTENRGKQIAVGGVILFLLFSGVISLLLFWRLIPGWVGEGVGVFAGLISSPFFLEASYFIIGLGIVVMLNSWRRKKEGDDFVEFDEREFGGEVKNEVKDRR